MIVKWGTLVKKNNLALLITLNILSIGYIKSNDLKETKMIKIGLNEEIRKQVAQVLNKLLSNEYVLYTKTLKFHWNVTGKHFGSLHEFFKKQYEQLFDFVDDVAERVRALGFKSFGSLEEFKKNSDLPENPGYNPEDLNMISSLLEDHEIIIQSLRENIDNLSELGDEGTANFLTDLMEKHEKMAWMLRAFLENN